MYNENTPIPGVTDRFVGDDEIEEYEDELDKDEFDDEDDWDGDEEEDDDAWDDDDEEWEDEWDEDDD